MEALKNKNIALDKRKPNPKKAYITRDKNPYCKTVRNYIDPGTGSMLFSVLIGFATAVFFSAKALIIKLKFLFSNRKIRGEKEKENIIIYSEGRQYQNVFKPILDEFENRKFEQI